MNNELIQMKDWIFKFKGWWAASFGIVAALIIGILIGILMTERKIMDDCKFISSFRIDSQGYNCIRR
jgi:hypothetical protein